MRLKTSTSAALRWVSTRLSLTVTLGLTAGLLVAAGVIALFAEISEDVIEGESRRFDRAVLLWINATFPGWLDAPMRLVTALGYYWLVIPLLAATMLVFYRKGWMLSAVLLFVSTAGGMVLTTVLKSVFQRTRPELFDSGYTASFYSFPSGHATIAVGFYGMLSVILWYQIRSPVRWLVAAGGLSLVGLIGFSRLYLGVHYPTDVLAGFLAAPLWVVTVGAAYFLWISVRRLAPRRRRKNA